MNEVVSGYPDDPGKVYLIAGGKRHWITRPEFLEQFGVGPIGKPDDDRHSEGPPITASRDYAALLHLSGNGIEIGALNSPSLLPVGATADYVDYISTEESKKRYPELEIVGSVIVDDGETLATFEDGSLDFIVANHFLEHTRNPLGVIRTHLSKLKPGGTLLYALPDKRHSFDCDRPVTPFQHLVMDDQHGPEVSDRMHYLEYVRYVDKVGGSEAIEAHATVLKNMDNRIHFHVWDAQGIREMFASAVDYLGEFKVVDTIEAGLEVVTVLKKAT